MIPIPRPRPAAALLVAAALAAGAAYAEPPASRQLAPGFTARPAASRVLVLPPDMELFSISMGGVAEPRADWTLSAEQNFQFALAQQAGVLGEQVPGLKADQLEDFAGILALHRAVADAIYQHHTAGGMKLPTKDGRLDWSLGAEAVRPLQEKTGADYALFTWVRDTYASNERKAAMFAMALLGAISLGGQQVGYASLVDLKTGRVVWHNELDRMSGDLRQPGPATETVEALFKGFPGRQ